ncbi:hypothetical protein LC593_14155 [Nostoc sp. CHAB 5844]|nr:hypothetical protein [Nostoc sp. CHAB 5844]
MERKHLNEATAPARVMRKYCLVIRHAPCDTRNIKPEAYRSRFAYIHRELFEGSAIAYLVWCDRALVLSSNPSLISHLQLGNIQVRSLKVCLCRLRII